MVNGEYQIGVVGIVKLKIEREREKNKATRKSKKKILMKIMNKK